MTTEREEVEAAAERIARAYGRPVKHRMIVSGTASPNASHSTTHVDPPQPKAPHKLSAEAQWIAENGWSGRQ
jgi:hypothetical protein